MDIKQDLIPKGRKRRPSISMKPQYITIHNTGCPNVPADNFRRSCLDIAQDKEVSFHYVIDEKEVIQLIPDNEVAWHAGNRDGNYTSVSVEVCERDGAEENAIKFVAQLCRELGFTTKQIRTHKSWSGKQCPWKILPHWDQFIANVEKELNNKTKINLNGVIKEVDAINKDGFTYIKLRDLADDKIRIDYDSMPIVEVIFG